MKEIITQNFNLLIDERCQCNVKHKLKDILVVIMCAVLCGLDTIADIVEYGEEKAEMLSEYISKADNVLLQAVIGSCKQMA